MTRRPRHKLQDLCSRISLRPEVKTLPVVLPHDEDVVQRLRSARQSVHYFQHNLAKLQELGYRHVVLCDGKVVGGGPTREAADAEADRNQAPPDRRIRLYVPQPGESYFY